MSINLIPGHHPSPSPAMDPQVPPTADSTSPPELAERNEWIVEGHIWNKSIEHATSRIREILSNLDTCATGIKLRKGKKDTSSLLSLERCINLKEKLEAEQWVYIGFLSYIRRIAPEMDKPLLAIQTKYSDMFYSLFPEET
jgi:hypothetical protein